MLTRTNIATYTITAVCAGVFIWQSISVTVLFYNQPVTTVFRKIHGNISALHKLTVCCTADECLGSGPKSPGLQYARGFWERQELPSNPNPVPTKEMMAEEMVQMGVDNPIRFLQLKSNISIFHQDLVDKGRFPDDKYILPATTLIGSLSSKLDLICVQAPNVINSLSNANTTHASRFFDDSGKMIRGEVTEIVFMTKFPATEVYYIALHNGPNWFYFPKPYLQRVVAHDYVNSSLSTYLRADIQRILKVSRRNYACIPTEPGAMYPARFAEYVCEQDCDEYVVRTLFGCSYSNILKGKSEKELPYCNKWELPNDPATAENITKVWQKCVAKHKCNDRHYCEEWDVKIQKTETLGPFKVVEENMTVHRFKIFVAPQLTKIEEELIMSAAQWVASVGGLMGMYIGLSLLSIFAIVVKFFQSLTDRIWPDRNEENDCPDTARTNKHFSNGKRLNKY